MVMPNEAPEYLRPQTSEDLSHIQPFSSVSITPEGQEALESGKVVGMNGTILNELNSQSPQYMAKLADYTTRNLDSLRRLITLLARQGYIRINISHKD